ncbi:MAG: TIM barrel protein [archaeon]|jgi:endonuclease IV
MVVAISTGCCHDLKLNRLESIHFLEKYPIDGVELLFAFPEELLNFELDLRALSFLSGLKFVSIHTPFENIIYSNTQETRKVLASAVALAKQVNAKYLVFHPQIVEDFNLISNLSIPVCIENMNKKEDNYKSVEEIKTLLSKYPFVGFVLDIAHALGNNIEPKEFLVLKDKIKGVHVSGQWMKKGNLKEHGFLVEGTKEQLEEIKPILELKQPKVIESDFYPEKLQLIEKEIQLLRNYFCLE